MSDGAVPLADRLDAALSKLAEGDGGDFTALVNGPECAAVLALDVKGSHFLVGNLDANERNLLFVLYLSTLTSSNPGPSLEAMRVVLSKPGGLALATGPVIKNAFPAYSLFSCLLPETYDQVVSMAMFMPPGQALTQSPVPGLEVMLAAGADPNLILSECPGVPEQNPSQGDTLLMSLAHYAAKLGEGGGTSYGTVKGYALEAAKVLVKHGASTDVKSTAAAYPEHQGKTMAEFAPGWFTAALSA
jgi:hypothetical protein